MNLIQRIIAWLATRFLTKYHVQDLFIDQVVKGNNEVQVLRGLFARYNSRDDVPSSAPGKNLNAVAMNHLFQSFRPGELAKFVYYKTIKENIMLCPSAECEDHKELFKKLVANDAANPMKRLATYKTILRENLHSLTETEIGVLASIAMTINHTNYEADAKFLETI